MKLWLAKVDSTLHHEGMEVCVKKKRHKPTHIFSHLDLSLSLHLYDFMISNNIQVVFFFFLVSLWL